MLNVDEQRQGLRRVASWLASLLLTYGICGLSGVNRLMSMTLRRYYSLCEGLTWGVLAVILILIPRQSSLTRSRWLLVGTVGGYATGVLVYQIAPVIRLASFQAASATIRGGGVFAYVGLSIVMPVLALSWLLGFIAAAIYVALTRRSVSDIRVALYLVGAVLIVGWTFFLFYRGSALRY
jgi:hypothetical protein